MKISKLEIHRKKQYDLDVKPLLCLHYNSRRVLCFWWEPVWKRSWYRLNILIGW